MTTTTRLAKLNRRTLIGFQTINDFVVGWADARIARLCRSVFSQDGVFDNPYSVATGNGIFTISGEQHCTDGIGNILNPSAIAYFANIPFQNSGGVEYDVALRRCVIPARTVDNSGVVINPGTGIPEFLCTQESIGEVADPDNVVDNGATITFVIDSVCEVGVTHAGRKCLVYLKIVQGATEAVAIEECTVVFVGGQNRITTTGVLGQTTVATDVTRYEVCLLGPTVRRNTDLNVEGYVFLGKLTGGNPSVWVDDQKVIEADLSEINADLQKFSETVSVTAVGGRRDDRPDPVYAAAAVGHDGLVYTIGGAGDNAYGSPTDQHIVYDPEGGNWSTRASLPYGAYAHVGFASFNNKLYAAGGYEATGPSVVDDFWSYDVGTDAWTQLANLPAARGAGRLIATSDRLYYLGGSNAAFTAQTTCWSYNPDTDLWSVIQVLPIATARLHAFVHNDKLIVWSGLGTLDLWEYDADADAWNDLADGLFETRYGFAFYVNGAIHIGAGLAGPGGVVRRHAVYSRTSNKWIELERPPLPHMYNGCSAVVNGVAFWIGGHAANVIDAAAVPWCIALDLRHMRVADTPVAVTHTGRGMTSAAYATLNETTATMPVALGKHQAVIADRSIWLTGGSDNADVAQSYMWRYFIDTNLWDRYTDFGETRCQPLLVEHTPKRKIYLFGGWDNVLGVNINHGQVFDIDEMTWDTFNTGVYVSEAGPGTRWGDKVWWSSGNDAVGYPSAGGQVRIYDFLWQDAGPVKDMGVGNERRLSISLLTKHVAYDRMTEEENVRVWSIGGLDPANLLMSSMNIYDVTAGVYTQIALANIFTSRTMRGCTDDRTLIFASGNHLQHFGEAGVQLDILPGPNSLLHEYDTAMVMFEGRVYQLGGNNNDGLNFATDKVSINTYKGSWVFYPQNFTYGVKAATISAASGDVYGFMAWNNRHVYEAVIVGVVE